MKNTIAVLFAVGAFAFIALNSLVPAFAENPPAEYRLLYEQRCDKPEAMRDFVFSDPAAWRIGKDEKGKAGLELFAQSKYEPKHRSPLNIALIRGKRFGDFRLDAEVMSLGKAVPHQDMCFFFGFQSPERFYYAHVALRQDAVAHRVTLVNDAPRAALATEGSQGVHWGRGAWHKVRLERKASDGGVKVFFDDMTKPVETANDKTFGLGYVGFGSFDDSGMVRNIKIYGKSAATGNAEFFKPAAEKKSEK
ncbi:MAG: hypothetical protein IT426_15610 [Pirellulales bacterium]|nr:hypothetical protein [Pirellulales bacterium]